MNTILVTGGCGFIGSHLVEYLLESTDCHIVILDRLDPVATLDRITSISNWNFHRHRVKFIWWDLKAELNSSVKRQLRDVTKIIHMASSSHVDRSIENPLLCVMDNVVGTTNLLEWVHKEGNLEKFVHISTDEVFGSADDSYAFKEHDPLCPENPYAATKMGAEGLVRAFACTFRIPALIVRMTNVMGIKQASEKFIPSTIKKVLNHRTVLIHSDLEGKEAGTRYYIDVRDVCTAIHLLLNNSINLNKENKEEGIYHISGSEEISNLYAAQKIAELLHRKLRYKLVSYQATRPYHDMKYRLDYSKLTQLGWNQQLDFNSSIKSIVEWYKNNSEWLDI